MPRIPLPAETIDVRQSGAFTAFRTVPPRSAAPAQIAALGGAVEAAGAATADIADVIQDDFDTARAQEAFNLWNEKNREALFDENGYFRKEGKDATGAGRKQAQDLITGEAEAIREELDNETQRGVFRQFVNNRMTEVLTAMDGHEIQQVKVYKTGQRQAAQRASIGDSVGAMVIGDVETYGIQKGVAVQRARQIADDLGYSEEQEQAFVQDTTTAIHAGVIEELIAEGRGDEARAYFEGVDIEEINPQERPRLKARVQRASIENRAAQRAFDVIDFVDREIQDQTPLQVGEDLQIMGDPTVRAPEDQLRERGREILDQQLRAGEITVEERDAVLARVEEQANFRRDVRVRETTDALIEAQQWLTEHPRSGAAQLPTELYETLREEGQLAAINGFADGRRYTTNPQVYASLLDMRRNPSVMRKPNGQMMTEGEFFLTYRPHLEDRHLQQVMAGYRVMTQAQPDPADESIWTPTERINFALREAGIDDEDDIDRVERVIQQRVNDATPPGGDRPRGEALQPIIDSVLLDEVRVRESFGLDFLNPDTRAPASLLTPQQVAAGEVEVDGTIIRLRDIPPEVRLDIERRLQIRGMPHSFTTIAQAWLRNGKPQSIAEAERLLQLEDPTIPRVDDLTPTLPGGRRNR